MAVVGIVPAAGYATRLQPLDFSKEVYPIGGRPVMDYLIERMRAGGCSELRVVTRPEKRDVAEHARRHRATVIEAHPETLAQSFLTGLQGLSDDDVVLLGFPDSIWDPVDGYARVLPLLERGWQVALGLFRAHDPRDLTRYEVVTFDDETGRVADIAFKPERPSSEWIWGCAVSRPALLRALEHESEPGHLFGSLARQGVVGGVRLPGTYLDMGTPQALAEALSVKPSSGETRLSP
jgi:glucose-1-phosphate thymidylyltransferase